MSKEIYVKAICKKTYPNEDDMQSFVDGKIKNPCDVRVYIKGQTYSVVGQFCDLKYWDLKQ